MESLEELFYHIDDFCQQFEPKWHSLLLGDRIIPVRWNGSDQQASRHTYPVEVRIEVIDRVGVLKGILSHLSDLQINVHKAQMKTFPGQTAEIDLGMDVRDHAHLEQTFGRSAK